MQAVHFKNRLHCAYINSMVGRSLGFTSAISILLPYRRAPSHLDLGKFSPPPPPPSAIPTATMSSPCRYVCRAQSQGAPPPPPAIANEEPTGETSVTEVASLRPFPLSL